MSHFTVTVKLSKARLKKHKNDIDKALEKIMEPYCEGTENKKFLEFNDETDDLTKKYENDCIDKVKCPDGTLKDTFDPVFKKKGSSAWMSEFDIPTAYKKIKVPFRDLYSSIDEYAKEWCGTKRDKETNKLGYWRNPNGFWDWFVIGGRWSGFYPLKSNTEPTLGTPGVFNNRPKNDHGDVVHIGDIDFDKIAQEQKNRADKFFEEYEQLLSGKQFDAFCGPRSLAMDIGLIKLVKETVQAGPGEVALPWANTVQPGDDRSSWTDLATVITKSELIEKYYDSFNPLTTFAYLDDTGWHQPGKMGWFGCDHAESDSKVDFRKSFYDNVFKDADPEDVFVLVDCHT